MEAPNQAGNDRKRAVESRRTGGMIKNHYLHRVRYRECDRMGIVYHAHFVDHFEAGRTELLREHGVNYKELEDSGILIQVVEVNVRYHKPAYYDDVLAVTTILEKPPEVTIDLVNEIRRQGEDELLVSGSVKLCFVDKQRGRPVRAPASILGNLFS